MIKIYQVYCSGISHTQQQFMYHVSMTIDNLLEINLGCQFPFTLNKASFFKLGKSDL